MTNHLVRSLLPRGMFARLLAGVLAFAVTCTFGAPSLRAAPTYE